MSYVLHLIVFFEIYAIFAISMNLIVGECGRLTLAHAAYFAIGAYAYAILTVSTHADFLIATVLSCIIVTIASCALSFASWRLGEDSFVLATLAIQVAITSTLTNWFDVNEPIGTLKNLTNGPFGISTIPRVSLLGHPLESKAEMAIMGGILLSGCTILMKALLGSPWGRLLRAMRDDELALRGLGKNTKAVKFQVFAIASATAGLAGSLYAAYVRYINPSNASFDDNVLGLAMLLVGGTGNLRGPLLGAAILTLLPELLRSFSLPDTVAANVRLLIYGCLLAVLLHFRPQGLAGKFRWK